MNFFISFDEWKKSIWSWDRPHKLLKFFKGNSGPKKKKPDKKKKKNLFISWHDCTEKCWLQKGRQISAITHMPLNMTLNAASRGLMGNIGTTGNKSVRGKKKRSADLCFWNWNKFGLKTIQTSRRTSGNQLVTNHEHSNHTGIGNILRLEEEDGQVDRPWRSWWV